MQIYGKVDAKGCSSDHHGVAVDDDDEDGDDVDDVDDVTVTASTAATPTTTTTTNQQYHHQHQRIPVVATTMADVYQYHRGSLVRSSKPMRSISRSHRAGKHQ